MKKSFFYVFLLCLLMAISWSAYAEEYVIGEEDMLQISVWGNPELNVHLPVRPDGMISVPLVGDIRAAGTTPLELKKNLEKELVKFVKAPVVSVMVTAVKSFSNSRIRVTGAVKAPGVFPYAGGMTALDAVLIAGGFTEFASQNDVLIVRKEGNALTNITVKLKDVMKGKASKNVLLKPGDIVSVQTGLF
jgi:polysaccharide export outer membrane protein